MSNALDGAEYKVIRSGGYIHLLRLSNDGKTLESTALTMEQATDVYFRLAELLEEDES